MFLSCTAVDHEGERVRWSLLDMTGEAEAELTRGRCPMCPRQPITRPDDRLPECSCCGSKWPTADGELSCLPGARTEWINSRLA